MKPCLDNPKELRKSEQKQQEIAIRSRVQGVVHGELRAVAASMSIEEIYNNRKQFQQRVTEYISTSLSKFGLVLYNANVKELKDDGGYFHIMGEKASQAAASVSKVSVAESRMLSDIGATERICRAQRETTRLKTDGIVFENQRQELVVQSQAELKITNAKFASESAVAEIEGLMRARQRDLELQKTLQQQRVNVELQKLRADTLSQAIIEGEKIKKLAEASAYQIKKEAEAKFFEQQKIAEGSLFMAQKEAEGTYELYKAQAEGLQELLKSFEDEDAAMNYLMVDKKIFSSLAAINKTAIQGLKPQFNIWTADENEKNVIKDLIKSLPPMLSAISDQTGINPPDWLAKMPVKPVE